MLLVVFLMGLHAAIFSPAKYGIVPEMLPDGDLSRGNALLEMSTVRRDRSRDRAGRTAGRATGTMARGASAPGRSPSRSPGCWRASASRASRPPAHAGPSAGIRSARLPILPGACCATACYGSPFSAWRFLVRRRPARDRSPVLRATKCCSGCILATGIGCGNLLAGKLSGDSVELGLIPIGSLGIGIFALVLCAVRGSPAASAVAVALLAVASGVFVLPQYAFMQQRAGAQEKGRTIATSNFIQSLGIILASLLLAIFHDRLHVSAATIPSSSP